MRRDELDSPSSSRQSSPDLDILDKLRANTQFDLIEAPISTKSTEQSGPAHNARDGDGDGEEEQELAFNLFAPTSKPTTADAAGTTTTAPVQTIRLRSPTPIEDQIPGFINPQRRSSYYFTGPLDDAKKAEYEIAAVTGEMVKDMSKAPCPGCAYPWKVINIPAASAKKPLAVPSMNAAEESFLPDEQRERKRKRLGKKARIKKRVKAEKAKAKQQHQEKEKEEKEKAEREKRARRNREKKFKKRARDKAKKAGVANGNEAAGDEKGEDTADESMDDSE